MQFENGKTTNKVETHQQSASIQAEDLPELMVDVLSRKGEITGNRFGRMTEGGDLILD